MQPIDPTPIAQNLYIQFGALALLAVSGWVVAWLLYREQRTQIKKYDSLLERVLQQNSGLHETLNNMADGLKVQDLLKDHLREKR